MTLPPLTPADKAVIEQAHAAWVGVVVAVVQALGSLAAVWATFAVANKADKRAAESEHRAEQRDIEARNQASEAEKRSEAREIEARRLADEREARAEQKAEERIIAAERRATTEITRQYNANINVFIELAQTAKERVEDLIPMFRVENPVSPSANTIPINETFAEIWESLNSLGSGPRGDADVTVAISKLKRTSSPAAMLSSYTNDQMRNWLAIKHSQLIEVISALQSKLITLH